MQRRCWLVCDVAGYNQIGAGLGGQGADAPLQRLALEGERQLGALRGAGRRDAPSQRTIVSDAHDDATLALHQVARDGKVCRSTFGHDIPLGRMHRAMRRPAVVAQGGRTEQGALENLSITNCTWLGIGTLACGDA